MFGAAHGKTKGSSNHSPLSILIADLTYLYTTVFGNAVVTKRSKATIKQVVK